MYVDTVSETMSPDQHRLLSQFFFRINAEARTAQSAGLIGDVLCGVMTRVPGIGHKVRGFNTGRDDGFLRAIKIPSTPSLGREVKAEVPCRRILRHVKNPSEE
jgi:hypothetical protein